jgi:hypothetical protein
MTQTTSRASQVALVLTALAFTIPSNAEAQRRGRDDGEDKLPWPSVMAGVTIGYDDRSAAELLGAQLRLPVLRNGMVELVPSVSATFANGLKEYQYNADLVFVTRGRSGGLYVGGGIAQRNTILTDNPDATRETLTGYNLVAGLKGGGNGELLGVQIESRWSFFDELPFDPRAMTLGVNFALTGRTPDGAPRR